MQDEVDKLKKRLLLVEAQVKQLIIINDQTVAILKEIADLTQRDWNARNDPKH